MAIRQEGTMSIQRGIPDLFALGDGCELDASKASQSGDQRPDKRTSEVVDLPLYGEAAAIRVLYQAAFLDKTPPEPPRPRRGLWVTRYLNSLSFSLSGAAKAKA
jgi:hypothetical protein